MLLSLTIADFVLVERMELCLESGFTVLTGETGAGKSILLDALALVLGARADAAVVRDGHPRADITAEFAIGGLPALRAWIEESGLEGDGNTLLLRRSVEAGGRSRAFVNGHPATLQQLREAGESLVDIHGQHAHFSLIQPRVQRTLLDAYAQAEDLAGRTEVAYRGWQQAIRRRKEAEARSAADSAERDRIEWLVSELTALDFRPDEWQALQEEHRRLAHAAELLGGSQEVAGMLAEEAGGALTLLGSAKGRLADLAEFDARLADCVQLLDSSLIQAQEASHELLRYIDRVELDPGALEQAEGRIARITDMARRQRVAPERLGDLLTQSASRLQELRENTDLDHLAQVEVNAEQAYRVLANELSERRANAAVKLGEAVSTTMQKLAMKDGRLEVRLSRCEPEAGGLESVEFQVSPHPGQPLRPLAKTASGGELSRLGLALQTVLAGRSGAATLIFDEVDSGIGGAVAEIVGRLLAELGRQRQVLCVTHLPQVAACAGQHWQVVKEDADGQARSRVLPLNGPDREAEIARMLGGVNVSETSRKHAREMLQGG